MTEIRSEKEAYITELVEKARLLEAELRATDSPLLHCSQMAWSHPNISIDDLLSLIKAFIDMLVPAFGYQSSGLTAKWDPHNVTKAIRWGLFFEEVIKGLHESSDYVGSVKGLDAALADLASDPLFLRH